MKYSEAFERDWNWYYKWKDVFTFSGKPLKFIAIEDKNGVSAKEAFYKIDSNGKNIPTKEPELLDRKSTRLNSSHIPLSRMPSSA